MVETLRIYRRLVAARVRAQLEYRASFTLVMIGSGVVTFLDFVELVVIFRLIPAMAGWSLHEVAFLYAITSFAFAFVDLVIGHLDRLPQMIRTGAFDAILVRPLGSLLQVVSTDVAMRRLGKAIQGVAVFAFALSGVDVDWTAGRVLMVPVMVASAAVIFGGIWVAGSTISFWVVDSIEAVNTVTYGGNYMTQHPLGIYPSWLRRSLAFVVPLAFVNYFPSLFVLGKEDPLGFPGWVRFLSPAVAVACLIVARAAWRNAVRHYRSTGS